MGPILFPRDSSSNGMGADHVMSHRTQLVVIVFLALGVYNAVEVFIKILRTFRNHKSIYFWSLIAASLGIILHALGYFFRNFNVIDSFPLEIFLVGPGGMMMITGQSVVLYSRLHLISRGRSKDRWLLVLILIDLLVVQVGATTLYAGSQSAHPEKYLSIYKVWERFQVTSFFVQECVISGLYIYRTYLLMKSSATFRNADTRQLLIHLVLVNLLVILLDVTILAFQYAGLYDIQTSWKTLAYSIKLKFEFYILNRLIELTKEGLNGGLSGPTGSRLTGSDARGTHNKTATKTATRTSVIEGPYARMGDDRGKELEDLSKVVKTTEISVTVEDDTDAMSESSTRELRKQNNGFK
ncbi:hypothetical protein N0V90_008606 [Kalmusia sp. IMI 367209]|nr:hypothetical protein N0V90_008606 [Kalmusia sp. IMI 367209]